MLAKYYQKQKLSMYFNQTSKTIKNIIKKRKQQYLLQLYNLLEYLILEQALKSEFPKNH